MLITIEDIEDGFLVSTSTDSAYSKRRAFNYNKSKESLDKSWDELVEFLTASLKPEYVEEKLTIRNYDWRQKGKNAQA